MSAVRALRDLRPGVLVDRGHGHLAEGGVLAEERLSEEPAPRAARSGYGLALGRVAVVLDGGQDVWKAKTATSKCMNFD